MTLRSAALTLVITFAVALPSAAGDLDGSYVLDLEASESIAVVLQLSGAPKFVGKLADKTKITMDVTVTDEQVTLVYRTRVYKRTEVMFPDGETREDDSHHKTTQVTQRWDERGGLESRTEMVLSDGESGAMVCTYRLGEDGETLYEDYLMIQADGTETAATRVYRRAD